MKKSAAIVLSLAVLIMLAAIILLGLKYKETTARYVETRQAEETVRGQFNAALESIAEIQESLDSIVPDEEKILRLPQGVEPGSPAAQSQRDRMLDTISGLKQSIENSKNRIRELEQSLENSRTEVAGLKRIIENLKKTVAEKEATIARLTARVDSLVVAVAELRTDVRRGEETIAEQQGVIEEKTKELGTIYYIIGTKNMLKDKGIIMEKGGVIGMGKSVVLAGTFHESDFTPLDTDRVRDLRIPDTEPQVLSAQSKSSYELRPAGEGTQLYITDPKEFRKVKYLVVMVKGK
jgi:uncharacterized protein YoxC